MKTMTAGRLIGTELKLLRTIALFGLLPLSWYGAFVAGDSYAYAKLEHAYSDAEKISDSLIAVVEKHRRTRTDAPRHPTPMRETPPAPPSI
jgi:hypothetical protein